MKVCRSKKCRNKDRTEKRHRREFESSLKESERSQLHRELITDSPEVSTDMATCQMCPFKSNCSRRIKLKMWIACEIPSMEDMMSYINLLSDENEKGQQAVDLLMEVAQSNNKHYGLPSMKNFNKIQKTALELSQAVSLKLEQFDNKINKKVRKVIK
jgi:hypothetical protein